MPDLETSLRNYDLGYYLAIAEMLGLTLEATEAQAALTQLVTRMLDASFLEQVVNQLPENAREALAELQAAEGRMKWSVFVRRYGEVREMGPARRDRLKPHRNPVSVAEILWYRGLVGRAFFDTPAGPDEFAYIPSDLLPLLSPLVFKNGDATLAERIPGRPATRAERKHVFPATDVILDHACTYLAALRKNLPDVEIPLSKRFLKAVLIEAGIIGEDEQPDSEETRRFLTMPRAKALSMLAHTWLESKRINDLYLLPHLRAEGEWHNDPYETRKFLLNLVRQVDASEWWSISGLLAYVKQEHAEFQRTAGDFDAWFLCDTRTGKNLRGFEHWDDVEGALLRYLLCGPLHWLGLVDLASASAPGETKWDDFENYTAFRLSSWAQALLENKPPQGLSAEKDVLNIDSAGVITASRLVPRAVRYQVARFCDWLDARGKNYRYQISASAMRLAQGQGLSGDHLLRLLHRYAEKVPPNVDRAVKQWEKFGSAGNIQHVALLRVNTPELLERLRTSPIARFLGEPVGPTAVIVHRGAEQHVLRLMFEMGYLGEIIEAGEGGETE